MGTPVGPLVAPYSDYAWPVAYSMASYVDSHPFIEQVQMYTAASDVSVYENEVLSWEG